MKRIVIAVLFVSLAYSVFAGGAEESSSGELSGEVNLFAWLPDNPDIVVNWVDKFEALYPDITVNTQMMTGNTLLENMQPRFASNTMPDVFSNELDAFSHSLVDAGAIADLGDTMAWADMVPAMQAAWTYGGVKYGISGGVATTLFYLN